MAPSGIPAHPTATPWPPPALHAPHGPPVVMATPTPTLFPSYSNGYYIHGRPYGHPVVMATPWPTLFPSHSMAVLMSTATLRPSPAPHAPHEPPAVMATPALALFLSHCNGYYVHGHPYGHPTVMATPTSTLFPSHSMASYVHGHPMAFTRPTCAPWSPCGHRHPYTHPISMPH